MMAELSLIPVQEAIQSHRINELLKNILMALVLAWLLSLLLTRQVLEPLGELLSVSQRVAVGDFSARVPVSRKKDEVALLGNVFNEMVARVEDQTQELELMVSQRTHELQVANKELGAAISELERLARTDGLTGLKNHRAFQEILGFEVDRSTRTGLPLSLLMIDVDHFKSYNDTHGHPAGDQVLRTVARTFQDSLRTIDVTARYGGEEFAVLLLETTKKNAEYVAGKLLKSISDINFPGAEHSQPGGRLTISIGVAVFPDTADTSTALVDHADQALYTAKRNGRNRSHSFDTPDSQDEPNKEGKA